MTAFPKLTDKKLIDILKQLPEDYELWWFISRKKHTVAEIRTWPLILNDDQAIYSTTLAGEHFIITAHLVTTVFRGELK